MGPSGADVPIRNSVEGEAGLPRFFATVFGLANEIPHGAADFVLPDGRRFRAGRGAGEPRATLYVHHPDLFARLVRDGDLGFCEAYLDGWWSTSDLQALMDLVNSADDELYDGFPGIGLVRVWEKLRFWMRSNSRGQARRNIAHHYDLGNDFYRLWLDETMTYSSALYLSGGETLERAQVQKYAALIDDMGVRHGDHILEIGCGWGGFAEFAARERGLRVTALTISREQHAFAVDRIRRAGLGEQVTIKLQDYRDEHGQYDGIASIEMFEAVGERYWPVYFNSVRENLRPGRNATLQIITLQDRRWEVYRRNVDFVQKYIFPGGMLPSPAALRRAIEASGLNVAGSAEFGDSYSRTLRHWYEVFNSRWEDISLLGFDDRFRRMWNLYLTSCAATFRSGNCDVTQITVSRPV